MNKNAIQKYAIWARNELRNQITQRAFQYGITPKERPEKGLASVNGIMLTPVEQKQRDQLVEEVWRKGFDQVIEELAYTWFNRLIAIRFMEVNDYLPEGVRVLSNSKNEFKPEILTSALNLDEAHFKKDLILKLIDEGKQEELYRYLLLAECNALNEILPVMFERMDGYTELMLPANLLKSDSVIGKLISDIDEADWRVTGPEDEEGGQVQIIGWLYQYYNSELKDETFADLKKKNKKISKERIPAATQLFTPDWIVRYMVENSLGKLWLEGHPNEELKKNWKYYLDEAEQEPEVEAQLKEIRKEYTALRPEDLSTADLAMGSGHILVYAFDVLMQIYRSEGYRDRDAVRSILENNLYGLDIDDRAAQLAYFAIMMKAREYDRRIFDRGIQPNVFSIQESNGVSDDAIEYFTNGDKVLKEDVKTLISEMKDAKEYGSIITTSKLDYGRIQRRIDELENDFNPFAVEIKQKITHLVSPANILSRKYLTIVMNPPYMGGAGMNPHLVERLKIEYKSAKGDLFSAFIVRSLRSVKQNGFLGFISPYVWMFISAYEEFRRYLYTNSAVKSLIQFEYSAFEEATVPICSFTLRKGHIKFERNNFFRLVSYRGGMSKQKEKYLENINSSSPSDLFQQTLEAVDSIPGSPLAYWATPQILNAFRHTSLYDYSISPSQNVTGDNNRFLRKHWELNREKIGHDSWISYAKGGGYRKWWGNLEDVINWTPEARNIYQYGDGKHASQIINKEYWYKKGITWGLITSAKPSFRIMPSGATFDKGGSTIIVDEDKYSFVLGLLNSKIYLEIAAMLNPTLNFQVKDVRSLPLILKHKEEVERIVSECVLISKEDWDLNETSIDFIKSPLVRKFGLDVSLAEEYSIYVNDIYKRFGKLKQLETDLNQLLVDGYGLAKEIDPIASDADVTVRQPNLREDVISLLSYIIGLIFGRYSLKESGVVYSGSKWDLNNYNCVFPDDDNIIPVGSDEYFDDDLISRIIDAVKKIYGEKNLEENLQFIAEALGGNGSAREVIQKYFLNDFFADHCRTFKKRPIYWLFDSGKKLHG